MSSLTTLLMCAVAVASATLAVAGPIDIDQSITRFETASEISEHPTTVIDSEPMKLIPELESKQILVDLERQEVNDVHRIKKRIRRSVLGNGKCPEGYVKVGKACMTCEELGMC